MVMFSRIDIAWKERLRVCLKTNKNFMNHIENFLYGDLYGDIENKVWPSAEIWTSLLKNILCKYM